MMPKTILPQRLQPGDQVALIAPAFLATEQQVQQAIARLEALNLKVINTVLPQNNDGYFASSAHEMVAKIHAAFAGPQIKALVFNFRILVRVLVSWSRLRGANGRDIKFCGFLP